MDKITPRVDVAFKKLFGVEENKDLLLSLINAIIAPEDQIDDLTLLNPYNPQNFRGDKMSILDVKAKALDGRVFNVEIQISNDADYDKRALYYWAKLYAEQLQAARDYSELNKAIGIHILNFISVVGESKYHNVFHIKEQESGLHHFKDLELHTIELTKFCHHPDEPFSAIIDKVKTGLDRWVTFLTRHELLNKEQLPHSLEDPGLKKALNVLEIMNFTPIEREAYEGHLKWLMVETNTLKRSKAEGKAEGKSEGKAEGKAELVNMMLAQGHSVESIAKFIGLSVHQLHALL